MATPDPLAEITEILRERHETGRYGDCRFDVHPTVLDLMRATQPPPPDPIDRWFNFGSGALRRLMGIPVVPDESLPPGGWQLVRMEHTGTGASNFTSRDVVLKTGAIA